jgi:UDP-glucose 4-epimerase
MRTAVSMDRMVQTFHYMEEGIETVLLRPVHIVSPRLKNAVTSYLKLPRIPVIMGYDPMLHVIHAEDMLAALVHSLEPGIHGVFNIAGTEAAPLSRLLQRLGAPTFPIPAPLARVVVDRLWRYGKLAFPPPEIDHLQYNHVVDLTRMRRELAFEPRHSWHDIIQELKVYRGRMRSR